MIAVYHDDDDTLAGVVVSTSHFLSNVLTHLTTVVSFTILTLAKEEFFNDWIDDCALKITYCMYSIAKHQNEEEKPTFSSPFFHWMRGR